MSMQEKSPNTSDQETARDSKYRWDLSVFYDSLEDPKFQEDWHAFDEVVKQVEKMASALPNADEKTIVEAIHLLEEFEEKLTPIQAYLSLSSSADQTNTKYHAYSNQISMKLSPWAVLQVALNNRLKSLEDLDAFIDANGLEEYRFILHEAKKQADYSMEEQLEALASKLNNSGGRAWGRMVSYLTSTLEVEWEGKTVTLSEIRNMANNPDVEIRKKAYEAELAAYKKIETPIAFALNSIKSQVNLLSKERKYNSPIEKTLMDSRMDQESLDSMLRVMEKSFPDFRRYLKAKAKLVGDGEHLRWYNLFAPVGKVDSQFTIEEAREYLVDSFTVISEDIASVIARAFDENWIDFLPRPGKSGGAFCSNQSQIKQSRVLTNFDGSYSAVNTLAHELGHAYHGYCIEDHLPLNQDYSMPVAETASTFNETHMTLLALENAENPDAKLAILEEFLSGTTQTIVDIYSRFLFEKEVFDRVDTEFLDSAALQDIMIRAQQASYGDAMPEDYRHPYMWACKGHYYSTGLSFYNFPYAFGAMFSMGLYTKYKTEGQSFMDKYKDMLGLTTVASCEDVANSVGVDLHKDEFWQSSIDSFTQLIDQYCELVEASLQEG